MTERPLHGIRVLDFSRVLAGPHCGRMLVDLGADVIKIEPPEGDLSRFGLPRRNSLTTSHTQQNLGKRNISLDLKRPEAMALLVELAARSDVVLENFRPGVMDRLGLGYDELARRNPRLVFASISGYGQDGRWASRRAYAPLVAAEMGYLWAFAHYRKLDVAQEPHSHADLYAGKQCLIAILSALFQRERTGRGQRIDVDMAESLLFANEYATTWLSGLETDALPRPATVASPVFRTASGRFVTVGGDPVARVNFEQWCRALDRPDLVQDPRFADAEGREKHRDALLEILDAWVSRQEDVEALDRTLHDVGLVLGVVRTTAEAGATDWARERGAVVEVPDRGTGTLRVPNTPWRFSEAATGARGHTAYRGEHNAEVLRDVLGLSPARITELEQAGVLSSRVPEKV